MKKAAAREGAKKAKIAAAREGGGIAFILRACP